MNARIVNLRTRRKQKARDARRKTAGDAPAAGVSALEHTRAEAENRRASERLDGRRLGDDPAGAPGDGAANNTAGDTASNTASDATDDAG